MPRKEIDPWRYRNPALPDLPTHGASATIKSLWVDRASRWINRQRRGIETWRPDTGQHIKIEELVDAYVTIVSILDESGSDAGFLVEFHMRERGVRTHEHMATFFFGPPRRRLGIMLNRQLIRTQCHL